MKASVIVTSYDIKRYDDLFETVQSILDQTYKNFELVLVLEDERLVDNINEDFSDDRIKIKYSEENLGLSKARNVGAEISNGELIIFTDDDIIAEFEWLEELVSYYKSKDDTFGVGGKCDPIWPNNKPKYIPPEFYWLFGVTHRHHPDEGVVRNTFGCNIAFNREHFLELGGFNDDLGKKHGKNIQGEETEMSYRISNETGLSMYYNPKAVINHKVYSSQLDYNYIVDRCFWQGYTKRVMKEIEDESIQHEQSYLKNLLFKSNLSNLKNIVKLNSPIVSFVHILIINILIIVVGLGYIYGKLVY